MNDRDCLDGLDRAMLALREHRRIGRDGVIELVAGCEPWIRCAVAIATADTIGPDGTAELMADALGPDDVAELIRYARSVSV